MTKPRAQHPERRCAQCGKPFVPKSRRNVNCSYGCLDSAYRMKCNSKVQADVPPMSDAERAKAEARCRRRLLEGVPHSDVRAMFGKAMFSRVLSSFTDEEKAQMAGTSAGIGRLNKEIGSTGGDWHGRGALVLTKADGNEGMFK